MDNTPSCPICFEPYIEIERPPRVLIKCGHTFCDNCIKLIISIDDISAKCPDCRMYIDTTNLSELPINFSLLQLSDTNNSEPALQHPVQSICDKLKDIRNEIESKISDLKSTRENIQLNTLVLQAELASLEDEQRIVEGKISDMYIWTEELTYHEDKASREEDLKEVDSYTKMMDQSLSSIKTTMVRIFDGL